MLAPVPASSKGVRGIVTRPGARPSVARKHQDPDGDLTWAEKHLEESVAGGSGCRKPAAEPQDRGGGSHHVANQNCDQFQPERPASAPNNEQRDTSRDRTQQGHVRQRYLDKLRKQYDISYRLNVTR
jgi:hypothetical protein